MKKIAFFLPDLEAGGAEVATVTLANSFCDNGYDVNIVVLSLKGPLVNQLDKRIIVLDLEASRIRYAVLPLSRYLSKNKPDVLLCIMWPLTIIGWFSRLLSSAKPQLVFSDHTTFSKSPLFKKIFTRYLIFLSMRFIYPLVDFRLAVSRGVAEDISRLASIETETIDVIPNPLPIFPSSHVNEQNLWGNFTGKKLITVGSLKPAKNHVLLLTAFATIVDRVEVKLAIIGDGELRQVLEDKIEELNLKEHVIMAGYCQDTSVWYKTADAFVLSSNYEGLPMVLIEALSFGLSIVSTDCESGPSEILDGGKYGHLVPVGDERIMASELVEVLSANWSKKELVDRSRRFSVGNIVDKYIELLFSGREA